MRNYQERLQEEYNEADKLIRGGRNIQKFQSRLRGKTLAYEKAIKILDGIFPELKN